MNNEWYEREDIRDKLTVFGRGIQGSFPYEVVIQPDQTRRHSGLCSFDLRRITVNPILFAVPAREQYLLTKALLVHEASHRRYTTPSALPPIIREVANILEDERVERRMYEEFIGVRWLIERLAVQFYKESNPIDGTSDSPGKVVSYFLQSRWATRIGRPVKGNLSASNQRLWNDVEPLVNESWGAESSLIVHRNAAKICDILGLITDTYKEQHQITKREEEM